MSYGRVMISCLAVAMNSQQHHRRARGASVRPAWCYEAKLSFVVNLLKAQANYLIYNCHNGLSPGILHVNQASVDENRISK